MTRAAVIALSHGGGPMPLMNDPAQGNITKSLKSKVPEILKLGTAQAPRAILVVTAHWSESNPTISSGSKPSLFYDYRGFPAAAYKLKYDAPGSSEVADEVATLLKKAGMRPKLNDSRGWDHGVFVPMTLINPQANVPVVQMSVLSSEDPEAHLRLGRALQSLRDTNVAIVGSGFPTFHNLRTLFSGGCSTPEFRQRNDEWSESLSAAVCDDDSASRSTRLSEWRKFPHAYEMHPNGGAEHFLPLLVCAGAAGNGTAQSYSDEFSGFANFSYYWD